LGQKSQWDNNSFQIFVQLTDHADMTLVSEKIKDAKRASLNENVTERTRHFPSTDEPLALAFEFKNGVNLEDESSLSWLFSIIAVFVCCWRVSIS